MSVNEIDLVIPPRPVTLEGFPIVRLLPYAKRRMVGPFIFLDHVPGTTVHSGNPLEVKPHPHIGLSTLSYLYKGQVMHRDSLGNEVILKPGDVNWMTAGNGIVHSERTPPELLNRSFTFQMLQFWVALPKEKEEMEASFEHHDAEAIPHFKEQDAQVRLIAGSAFGKTSPVNVFSKLFFMSIQLKSGGKLVFDTESQDAALYLLSGALELSQTPYGASSFITFKTGTQVEIQATEPCELVLFGGESLPEPRTIYWNFVATSKDKIEAAKTRWQERKFPKVIHDEDEYTPLPPQF